MSEVAELVPLLAMSILLKGIHPILSVLKIGKFLVKSPQLFLVEKRFISLLQSCAAQNHLQQIQSQIIIHGLQQNPYVAPNLISAAFRSSGHAIAHQLFDQITEPNAVAWNAMLRGFATASRHADVLALFQLMHRNYVLPNMYTVPVVLKACAVVPALAFGNGTHCLAIKTGFDSNGFVGTTLVEMYSAGRDLGAARKSFEGMLERNVVAWTSIVTAYLSEGDLESGRSFFDQATERDAVLWNVMIVGYIEVGDMDSARELFDQLPEQDRDVISWNTLLLGYVDYGNVESCKKIFNEMPQRNVFSWNGLISGYARQGQYSEVLHAFARMLKASHVSPNDATLVSVLSACSKLGALAIGRRIHVYVETNGFNWNVYVGNGLIDMYSKCGCIDEAMDIFHRMRFRDVISWNSMIAGLAMHGRGSEALELFEQMKAAGETPDGITFVAALSACVHIGLVDRGFAYFNLMKDVYLITPWIEHYGCMVDMLGRAGLLLEALGFVKKMPIEPDSVIWSSILGACQVNGAAFLGELVLSKIVKLEPEDVTNYVVLSNIYSAEKRWRDVAILKRTAKGMSSGKLHGCSSVMVNSGVVNFRSSDSSHPRTMEIYGMLQGMRMLCNSVADELTLEGFHGEPRSID